MLMSRFVGERGRMENQRSQDTELSELRLESLNSQVGAPARIQSYLS
jgi:hypothetical protein